MSLETSTTKAVHETTRQTLQAAESLLRKAWTILDAAAEKKPPSEYLKPQAIAAMQGKKPG